MGDNRSQKRMGGRVRNRSRSKVQDKIRGKVQSKVRSVVRNAFEQGTLGDLKAELLKEVLGIVPAAPVEKPKKPKTKEGSETRECTKCGRVKPVEDFRSLKAIITGPTRSGYTYTTCRICRNIPTHKSCSECGKEHPVEEFSSAYRDKQGVSSRMQLLMTCTTCRTHRQSGEKFCVICGEYVPLEDFPLRACGKGTAHYSICKQCSTSKTRTCNVCGEEKPISYFIASSDKCTPCYRAIIGSRQSQKVSNSYVATSLGLRIAETSPELVEAKREQLLLYRELKALKTQLAEEENNGAA